MFICWDDKADCVYPGDNGRDISPIFEKTYKDDKGYVHYIFSKLMFNNPKFQIPKDDFILFKRFLDGGSRSYPSDGAIPLDIVATEASIIIHKIMEIASTPTNIYYEDAKAVLEKGKYNIIRGCVKLYLKKYTSRDWRRKRFTDDIDFWIYKLELFHYLLKSSGWRKNEKTKEWEKRVDWIDYDTNLKESGILIASNDLNLAMDFGNCSYLDGSDLKAIFKKKLKRGHDVDLSDIINVAMELYNTQGKFSEDWKGAWEAVEESANTRNARIVSNLISLCRYALGIADYIERSGNTIKKYHQLIYDKSEYPDDHLKRICRYSPHWTGYLYNNGPKATRSLIYSYLIEQQTIKRKHSKNLRNFAGDVLNLINSKLSYIKIIIEINS
ncbi:MAG: hypothetical protein ACTSQJ_10450 [Promethearchaeota archaeon]